MNRLLSITIYAKGSKAKWLYKSPEEEAKMQQWSLWATTELEAIVLKNFETKVDVSTELEHPLTAFDKELEGTVSCRQ